MKVKALKDFYRGKPASFYAGMFAQAKGRRPLSADRQKRALINHFAKMSKFNMSRRQANILQGRG